MKMLLVKILFFQLLVSAHIFAAQPSTLHHRLGYGSFSFSDEDQELSADSAQSTTDKLFLIINQAILIATPDKDRLAQLSPTEVTALFVGERVVDPDGDAANEWLAGCSEASERAAGFLHSQLTTKLLALINVPLKNDETAYEMAEKAGCPILAKVIKKLSVDTAS